MKAIQNLVFGPQQARGKYRHPLLVFAAVIAVALGGFWLLAAVSYPWSVSLPGRPALVGKWLGELILPAGRKQWVALDLSAEPSGRNGSLRRLKGFAQVCGAQGMRGYEGSSKPQNWHGTLFNLALGATDASAAGLILIKLDAEWDRQDVIRARARFEAGGPVTVAIDRDGTVTRPGADPDTLFPVSFTLRRGSERDFTAACARVSSHAALKRGRSSS